LLFSLETLKKESEFRKILQFKEVKEGISDFADPVYYSIDIGINEAKSELF
jgi:hypothetical protein